MPWSRSASQSHPHDRNVVAYHRAEAFSLRSSTTPTRARSLPRSRRSGPYDCHRRPAARRRGPGPRARSAQCPRPGTTHPTTRVDLDTSSPTTLSLSPGCFGRSGESSSDSGAGDPRCSADAGCTRSIRRTGAGEKTLLVMTSASTMAVGYGVVRMGGGRCGTQTASRR